MDAKMAQPHPVPEKRTPVTRLRKISGMGIFLAAMAGFLFSTGTVIVQQFSKGKTHDPIHDGILVLLYRACTQFISYAIIVLYKRHSFLGVPLERKFIILRSCTSFVAIGLLYSAATVITIGEASGIFFSAPVFVGIFARIFLKEPCNVSQVLSTFAVTLGLALITFTGDKSVDQATHLQGIVLAFVAAVFNALTMIAGRPLQKTPTHVVMADMSALFVILSAIILSTTSQIDLPTTLNDGLLLLAIGIVSTIEQGCLTVALKIEDAVPVSLARTLAIVFSFMYQILLGQEVSHFSAIGSAIILLAVLVSGLYAWYLKNPDSFSGCCCCCGGKTYDMENFEKPTEVVTTKSIKLTKY